MPHGLKIDWVYSTASRAGMDATILK